MDTNKKKSEIRQNGKIVKIDEKEKFDETNKNGEIDKNGQIDKIDDIKKLPILAELIKSTKSTKLTLIQKNHFLFRDFLF